MRKIRKKVTSSSKTGKSMDMNMEKTWAFYIKTMKNIGFIEELT